MSSHPKKYFKYLRQQHLKSFFKHGDIRISTLHDFQSNEKYSHHILDEEEGVKSIHKLINWHGGPDDQPAFDRKFFSVGAQNVTIKNILVQEESKSQNVYIYSVSASFSIEIMKKMNPDYDACFVILDPDKFFQNIATKIQNRITECVFGACHYIERNLPYDERHNIHPAWIKDPVYSYQEEYRMIMSPKSSDIEPFNIKSEHATKFCKPYYIA